MMKRSRRLMFILAALTIPPVVIFAAVFMLDLYLHQRYEMSAGLNKRGYRGPVLGRKRANEARVAVVGGSTAFGYGVTWDNAFPALLSARLNESLRPSRQVSVANLGYNNEGAYSFKYTLSDFLYLEYDTVLIYTGYNDLGGANTQVYRHQSPVFRLTGYMPILPVVLREKAMALRAGGDLEGAYAGKVAFSASRQDRTAAAVLDTTVGVLKALEGQLGRLSAERPASNALHEDSCAARWQFYCQQVYEATLFGVTHDKEVLIVTEPYISDSHVEQQSAMANMILGRFRGNPRVRYVNLGPVVDLKDGSLAWDGMHLTIAGNRKVADSLARFLVETLGS
jgi:lysophospholipase L1-like esterase